MGVVSLAVIYNAIMIIVRATYHQFNDVLLPLWLVLDYGADIIYIMDMGVQGTTSKFERRTSNILLALYRETFDDMTVRFVLQVTWIRD